MAGGPKICFALSMPITSAASDTSNMNGHMIRVSKIVSAVLSGDQLPHVKRSTSCGANRIPSSVTALMKTAVSVATLFASRHADLSPSTAIFCENVVMNAVESAPSANKSRSKFGNRNAIRNASRFLPAPNRPAKTISRIKPSTRLHRIAMPTIPVARVLTRRSSAAAIGEQRTVSQDLRKKKLRANRSQIRRSWAIRVVQSYNPAPGAKTGVHSAHPYVQHPRPRRRFCRCADNLQSLEPSYDYEHRGVAHLTRENPETTRVPCGRAHRRRRDARLGSDRFFPRF